MENQPGWAYKLGGVEPLRISRVGHTVLARLMESQIWHQPMVSERGEGSEKGQWPLLTPVPDTSVSPCIPLVPFKLPPQCWSSEGASLSRWVCVWVSQEELLKALAASSTNSVCTGFCSQKCGDLSSWHWNPGLGFPGMGLRLLAPKISLPNFYPHGYGASLFHIHSPPTSLYGYGMFSSIVVRLPFNWFLMFLSDSCSIF